MADEAISLDVAEAALRSFHSHAPARPSSSRKTKRVAIAAHDEAGIDPIHSKASIVKASVSFWQYHRALFVLVAVLLIFIMEGALVDSFDYFHQ